MTPVTTQAKPGESLTFTVSALSETGYANYVNLIVAGVPSGSISKLEPTSLSVPSQSTLTLELGKDVTPGVYVLVVTGSGQGGQSATATFTVIGTQALPAAQPTSNEDSIITGLAAVILAAIIAAIAAGVFLTFRHFRTKRAKVYCIECGAQITPGLPFCRNCGVKQPQPSKEN